jgi:protein SCO1/2
MAPLRRLFAVLLAAPLLTLTLVAPLACRRSDAAAAQALPQLGTVGPFWLTDQDGRSFSEQSLSGKVWVAAFMFTRCPSICPEMTRRMRYLQEQAQARHLPLNFVSFSVDPDNDTPPVLRQFAAQYGADTRSWSFLTGDNSVIRAAAEQGFKIGVDGTLREGADHMGITHGTHLVLLDGSRSIRGYYQSSEPAKLQQLLQDAAALVGSGNS